LSLSNIPIIQLHIQPLLLRALPKGTPAAQTFHS